MNKRVVIIGGGFGGLNCAKALKKAHLDLLLIDKHNHHLFQPLLYQVASAALSPANIATSLREIFAHQKNMTVIMGTVERIDKTNRIVVLLNGTSIPYDYLVIAVGAHHSYFGHDEWEALAPGLKTISDALTIRERLLIAFEKAERMDDEKEREKHLQFVVIGGGPTGVEMAGAIAEIAHQTMVKNFRKIRPEKSKIYLIEGASRILPSFPDALSNRAQKDLEKMGVQVIIGKTVTNITEEGVQIGPDFIFSKSVIWAAGNQGCSLLKTLDIPLDRQGRAHVQNDLSIENHPEIFIIGDAACTLGKNQAPLPAVAPVAIQQGRYVAHIIRNHIAKEKRDPFKYFDKGSLATIGKNKAVGFFRKIYFKGIFAWMIWGFVHIAYLVNYRSRFLVMFNWILQYLTGMRGARLIRKSID